MCFLLASAYASPVRSLNSVIRVWALANAHNDSIYLPGRKSRRQGMCGQRNGSVRRRILGEGPMIPWTQWGETFNSFSNTGNIYKTVTSRDRRSGVGASYWSARARMNGKVQKMRDEAPGIPELLEYMKTQLRQSLQNLLEHPPCTCCLLIREKFEEMKTVRAAPKRLTVTQM